MSVLKLLLFAREKIILITPYTAVSRSIMGLGRIDMEGVAGGGIEVFESQKKYHIRVVSGGMVWERDCLSYTLFGWICRLIYV